MGLKDSLIQDLKNIQNNQDVLIVSLKDKDKISDQEIKNLQKTLVIENKKTVYKIVGSFIAGAITYYVLDRSRNH
jgi:phosphotransferase system IIB component